MIEVKNVSHAFDGVPLLTNYSITMKDNCIYAVTGKSGCGKTTLIRMIAGLLKPNCGEIYVDGHKVTKPDKSIGLMHQRYVNFPWLSVLDNALFAIKVHRKVKPEDKEKAITILNRFGLGEDLKKKPHELSGGMNQRLAMAGLIMHDPQILLMDEPLSALDPENREVLQKFLEEFNDGSRQIIIITHSNDEAQRLSKGKIIHMVRGDSGV